MKKWFLILVAVLGFSSFAGAQKFSVGGGLISFGDGFNIGFGINLGIEDLVKFSQDFGLDARVDFEGVIAPAPVGLILLGNVGVYGSYQISDFDIYFGPRFVLVVSPTSLFFVQGLLGIRYDISKTVGLYVESRITLIPALGYSGALGVRILL